MKFKDIMTERDLDRFEKYVPMSHDKNGCCRWTGPVQTFGRPQVRIDGVLYVATRVIYSLHHDIDVPDRYEDGRRCVIAHRCHVIDCMRIEHLEMTDQKGNMKMSYDDGKIPVGQRRWNSKLTVHAVKECRRMYYSGKKTVAELAKLYGVKRQTMGPAILGRTWKSVKEGLNYRKIEPTEGTFKHVKTEDGTMHVEETIDDKS